MLNNQLFLSPLRQYLKVMESDKWLEKIPDKEVSKLCLSFQPIAVMNIWETLIEAQKNIEFSKFMLTMGKTEDDFRGDITGYNIYKHKRPLLVRKQLHLDGNSETLEVVERLVYMPSTKAMLEGINGTYEKETLGPLNPYKCFKTAHSTISKTLRNIESLDLEYVYSLTFTFPQEVSKLYINHPRPHEIDERLNKCMKNLSAYLSNVFDGKIGMAANRHVWSSASPLTPHAHFHVLLLDRVILKSGTEKQITPRSFMEWNSRERHFEEGALTKSLKRNWASIVNTEFGVDYHENRKVIKEFYQELDVNVSFVELKKKDGSENERGHKKLIHKMKYNRRRPLADLALFYLFNEFDMSKIDDEFAQHLIDYENRTQIFGYWNRMSDYAKKPKEELKEREAKCPLCNEVLEHVGYVSIEDFRDTCQNVRKAFVDRKGTFWLLRSSG
jgi:hypothetical protein